MGSMEVRNEQLGCNTPDFHLAEREHEDWGSGVQRPSKINPERTFCCSMDADNLVGSGRSKGKSWRSGRMTARTDHHQLRRGGGLTGLSGVPHLSSISRRGPPKHLVPSKPSCNPSPLSMPNIRFVSTPRL